MRVLLALLLAIGSCSQGDDTPLAPEAPAPRAVSADTVDVQGVRAVRAQIEGGVTGTVVMRSVEGGTRVLMDLDGLTRDHVHGVQVLSDRQCVGANPERHLGDGRAPHGPYDAVEGRRHAGDLGNIVGNDRGQGRFDRIDPHVRLDGYLSAANRVIVIRERLDDGWASGGGSVVGCGELTPIR